jgi:hypothetical protein
VFSFICSDPEGLCVDELEDALVLLKEFDSAKAESYGKMLNFTEGEWLQLKENELTGGDFGHAGDASEQVAVNKENLSSMIIHSARDVLISSRSTSLTIVSNAFYDCLAQLAKQSKDNQDDHANKLFTELTRIGGVNFASLMCGDVQVSPQVVKNALNPVGWLEEHMPSFFMLQDLVGNLKTEDLKAFLQFVISSSACASETRIHVKPDLRPGAFPTASTCEKVLHWPVMNTGDHGAAEAKLLLAIRDAHSNGFERE